MWNRRPVLWTVAYLSISSSSVSQSAELIENPYPLLRSLKYVATTIHYLRDVMKKTDKSVLFRNSGKNGTEP